MTGNQRRTPMVPHTGGPVEPLRACDVLIQTGGDVSRHRSQSTAGQVNVNEAWL